MIVHVQGSAPFGDASSVLCRTAFAFCLLDFFLSRISFVLLGWCGMLWHRHVLCGWIVLVRVRLVALSCEGLLVLVLA